MKPLPDGCRPRIATDVQRTFAAALADVAATVSEANTNLPSMKWIVVTPDIAKSWLKKNTHNRRVRRGPVRKLANDMQQGKWCVTHQGIAFSVSDWLLDGQHRLEAIIESNTSQMMPVFFGVPDIAQMFVDDHARRTPFDALSLLDGTESITELEVQIARLMVRTYGWEWRTRMVSKTEIVQCLQDYGDAITFSAMLRQGRGVMKGVTMVVNFVAIARAYYHLDESRLTQFFDVLHSGIPQDGSDDTAAITYRSFLLTYGSRFGHGGSGQSIAYKKCERMIKAFCDREPLTKCYAATGELFPLPGENGDTDMNLRG